MSDSPAQAAAPPATVPAVAQSQVKVGDKVWYVPSWDHELDEDHEGNKAFVFEFAHSRSTPQLSYQQGQRVENFGILGRGRWRRDQHGHYVTPAGVVLRVVGPGKSWPALVRQVFADGTVALDIAHPFGASLQDGHGAFSRGRAWTLHYPHPRFSGNGGGVSYDKTGTELHSYHLLADAKETD